MSAESSRRSLPFRIRDAIQRHRWSRWLVDLLLIAVVLVAVSWFQSRNLVPRGEPAPPIRLVSTDGQTVDLSEFRGRPVLLAFWAPWCGVCRAESDNLSRLQRWVKDRATVVSVAVEYGDIESVRRYMREQGVDYPVLLGVDRTVSDYRLTKFPTTYFIDSDGRVKRTSVGYTTTVGMLVRLML